MPSNDTLLGYLDDIDARGQRLTPWEIRFVADMIDRGLTSFTDRQGEIIQRIWEEKVD
jgi:hypothetical protein